eukprot:123258-Hanusia_phi.AAC.10
MFLNTLSDWQPPGRYYGGSSRAVACLLAARAVSSDCPAGNGKLPSTVPELPAPDLIIKRKVSCRGVTHLKRPSSASPGIVSHLKRPRPVQPVTVSQRSGAWQGLIPVFKFPCSASHSESGLGAWQGPSSGFQHIFNLKRPIF